MKPALAATLWLIAAVAGRAGNPADKTFLRVADPVTGRLTSLRHAKDADRVEFIRPGAQLGAVTLRVRTPGAAWRDVRENADGVELRSNIISNNEALRWEIRVRNTGRETLEIGDLALPLPMNTDYVWDHEETFVRRVFRHAFIAGHGSFLYWLPVKGKGRFLVMLPEGDTRLEYFTADGMDYAFGKERFSAYVHSIAAAETDPRGTWRQPQTSRVLEPHEEARYAFAFYWADSHDAVRALLRRHGGVNVQVAPGMVVPRDHEVRLALGTQHKIDRIAPGFPDETTVQPLVRHRDGTSIYQVSGPAMLIPMQVSASALTTVSLTRTPQKR